MSDDVVRTLDTGCGNLGNLCAQQVSLAQAMFGDSAWWAAVDRKEGISCGSHPTIARWCNFLAFLARVCGDEGLK